MHFEGEFRLPGTPAEVIERFTDIPRMASCVPGAELEGRDPDGSYTGALVVAFGPKRIKFRGKVFCDFDIPGRSGELRGRGVADMRAARFEVRTRFSVIDDTGAESDKPFSLVRISSDANLQGVLAAFANAGGQAVGDVLMQEFARKLAAEYGEEREPSTHPQREVDAVSAHRVVWSAVKGKAASLLSKESKKAADSETEKS